MISALIIIIGLSLLILVHELGHFIAAKYFGVRVEEFGFGFPPRLWAKKYGETVYSFNALPFGGFVRLYGEQEPRGPRSFLTQSGLRRATIIVAGVFLNFVAGWWLLSAVYSIGLPPVVVITQVFSEGPAAAAGFEAGDVVLNFKNAQELVDFIKANAGREITLTIQRRGDLLHLSAAPDPLLGLGLSDAGIEPTAILESLYRGLTTSIRLIGAILVALGSLFQMPEAVVGPVGILDIAVKTGSIGLVYLLQMLALISLNLAVLNILPIPALDGGRLFFIIIEKLRGRAIDFKKEARANFVGFVVLLALIILVTIRDIVGLLN